MGEKLDSLANLVKNSKTLVLTAITLLILGLALISGDAKDIFFNLYKNVTGQTYQSFSPVRDYSNPTYLALKDKFSRDTGFALKHADITIFEESDTEHSYRIELNGKVYFYAIKQKANGVWQIIKEE